MTTEMKLAQLREDRAFAKSKMDIAEMTDNKAMYDKYATMFDEATEAIRNILKGAQQ